MDGDWDEVSTQAPMSRDMLPRCDPRCYANPWNSMLSSGIADSMFLHLGRPDTVSASGRARIAHPGNYYDV